MLPDGKQDAQHYELNGFYLSEQGWSWILSIIHYPDTWLYSKLIGIIYLFVPRDIFFLQLINITLSIITIYLTYQIIEKLWKKNENHVALWFLAFYPVLIQYSSLTLKESFFCFFLMLGINEIINWYQKKKIINLLLLIIFIFIDSAFYIVALVPLILFIMIEITKLLVHILIKLNKRIVSFEYYYFLLFIIGCVAVFSNFSITIPYFEDLSHLFNFENWKYQLSVRMEGDAQYSSWLIPNSIYEVIYKIPIRTIYFFIGPFFWEINKTSHFFGYIDGFIYIIFLYYLVANIKKLFTNEYIFFIFLSFVVLVVLFAIGTGNFGTGMRHRTKFIYFFVIFTAPFLPYFPLIKLKK